MRKRKLKMASGIFLLLLIAGLSGCGQKNTEKENLCHIVLEAGEGYHVTDPARTIKSGSDVSFTITLDDNWQFLGTDYHSETEITKEDDGKTVNLVLHEVNYSESICIQAEKGKYEIVYDANGGQNISGDSDRVSICYRGTHQRIGSFCQRWIHTAWMEYQSRWNRTGSGARKPDRMERRTCAVCTMDSLDRRGRFCIQKSVRLCSHNQLYRKGTADLRSVQPWRFSSANNPGTGFCRHRVQNRDPFTWDS